MKRTIRTLLYVVIFNLTVISTSKADLCRASLISSSLAKHDVSGDHQFTGAFKAESASLLVFDEEQAQFREAYEQINSTNNVFERNEIARKLSPNFTSYRDSFATLNQTHGIDSVHSCINAAIAVITLPTFHILQIFTSHARSTGGGRRLSILTTSLHEYDNDYILRVYHLSKNGAMSTVDITRPLLY